MHGKNDKVSGGTHLRPVPRLLENRAGMRWTPPPQTTGLQNLYLISRLTPPLSLCGGRAGRVCEREGPGSLYLFSMVHLVVEVAARQVYERGAYRVELLAHDAVL